MFAVNVIFCLIVSILVTLVVAQAEMLASRGPMLADAQIAAGRSAIWSVPALPHERAQLR